MTTTRRTTYSNAQRSILRHTITRHPDWPLYASEHGITSAQISASQQITDICAALQIDIAAALREGRSSAASATRAFSSLPTATTKPVTHAAKPTPKPTPTPVIPDGPPRHREYTTLLTALRAGLHCYLAGEASSGKSVAAHTAAKELGLPFFSQSVCTEPYEITGYLDATSTYVTTPFVRAFQEGGLVLLDEIDADVYSPGALLAVNAALAQGTMALPGGTMIEAHKDFLCVAAGNTWGLGADSDYSARNKLDGATISRFSVRIQWDCDTDFERAIVASQHGTCQVAHHWLDEVQRVRSIVNDLGLPRVCDFRTFGAGYALLTAGLNTIKVRAITYEAQLDRDQRRAIRSKLTS